VTADEAVDFLRPAVPSGPSVWADLGAGSGTFTEALALLLGPGGRVLAVERDRSALRELERLATHLPAGAAAVGVVPGDLDRLGSIPAFADVVPDGALLANVLHFFSDPSRLLGPAAALLAPEGRIVVVEYGGATRNRWVPHPIPLDALARLARALGLTPPRVVSERPSRYQQGALYCAVLERDAGTAVPWTRE
jgi:SAM-dependent methyltransferase